MAKGIDFLVSVNTGTTEAPVWVNVGGQRGASLSRGADNFESTSKDSNGWKEFEAGMKEWSIECDGLLVESDAGYKALEDAYLNGEKVKVQVASASGSEYSGMAIVSDLPIEMPYDDLATWTATFQGSGELAKK